jgi:hypothetical protein
MTLRVIARSLFSTILRDDVMQAVQDYLPVFSDGGNRRMTQPITLLSKLRPTTGSTVPCRASSRRCAGSSPNAAAR